MKLETARKTWSAVRAAAIRLHRDDRGAEALEKLLIVAVVVLPLLGALIFFRDEINDWVGGEWTEVVNEGGDDLARPVGAPE
ncbi:MAG: hypothetical protein AAGH92_00360 [Planctomycetota bacterium]